MITFFCNNCGGFFTGNRRGSPLAPKKTSCGPDPIFPLNSIHHPRVVSESTNVK
jgi:hypothetical protein